MAHTLDYAPVINENVVAEEDLIQIQNPNLGTQVYYTLDGSDPMGPDGTIASNAHFYYSAFQLPVGNYKIVTRAFTTNNWGPKSEKSIQVKSVDLGELMITGINYKPVTDGDAEFLLLSNVGSERLDISNFSINDAIKFTFPVGTFVETNETILLGKKLNLIEIADSYRSFEWTSGSLSNDGEPITILDANGQMVDFVYYKSQSSWPTQANGNGCKFLK